MNFRHCPGVICVKNLRECGIFESPLGSPCENLHGIMQMGLNPETLILNFAKKSYQWQKRQCRDRIFQNCFVHLLIMISRDKKASISGEYKYEFKEVIKI